MALKENYVDDILNTSKNTKRKYNIITNADGTVSFEDVTEYSQMGDNFGAADLNVITKTINSLLESGITVRYDEKTDFLQVLKNGEWVDGIRIGLLKEYAFLDGNNKGEFSVISSIGSLTVGDDLVFTLPQANADGTTYAYMKSGVKYNLSKFSSVNLEHSTVFTTDKQGVSYNSAYNHAKLQIIDASSGSVVASTTFANTSSSTSGVVSVDVSSLGGEHYIQVALLGNSMKVASTISEIVIEP